MKYNFIVQLCQDARQGRELNGFAVHSTAEFFGTTEERVVKEVKAGAAAGSFGEIEQALKDSGAVFTALGFK